MKIYKNIIIASLLLLATPGLALSASLDELYRDIVRSDNQGYLPIFVKNRALPDILMEEEILRKLPLETPSSLKEPIPEPVNLANERAKREAAIKAAQLKWINAVKAVAANQVTPLVLDEINNKVIINDPKAVEILAYMNARGVGVQPNLLRSFELYSLAAGLGVPQATDNARKVWRSMNAGQRQAYKEVHR